MLKIVHAADIHAGRPASRELDREKASVRRREIETGLSRIADLCKREKADLLLLSGDLFEHSHVRATWAREAREVFRSLDQTRVFISPWNHDPLVRDSLYKTAAWPENVTVFEETVSVKSSSGPQHRGPQAGLADVPGTPETPQRAFTGSGGFFQHTCHPRRCGGIPLGQRLQYLPIHLRT